MNVGMDERTPLPQLGKSEVETAPWLVVTSPRGKHDLSRLLPCALR
jgi:hypothetical protein